MLVLFVFLFVFLSEIGRKTKSWKTREQVLFLRILFFHLYKFSTSLGHHNPRVYCSSDLRGFFSSFWCSLWLRAWSRGCWNPCELQPALASCWCWRKHPLGSALLESPRHPERLLVLCWAKQGCLTEFKLVAWWYPYRKGVFCPFRWFHWELGLLYSIENSSSCTVLCNSFMLFFFFFAQGSKKAPFNCMLQVYEHYYCFHEHQWQASNEKVLTYE